MKALSRSLVGGAAILLVGFLIYRQSHQISISITNGKTSPEAAALRLTVGPDKCSVPRLAAGETASCIFHPTPVGEIWLSYRQGEQPNYWNGPTLRQIDGGGSRSKILEKTDGLRLSIRLEPNGQVTSQQCYWPCLF